MSTITDLSSTDSGSTSLTTINDNFDNLNADKAEITGQVFTGQVSFSGTTHAGLKVLSLTTTQRDALTPANGMLIYNSTTNKFQSYENGAWGDLTAGAADATTSVKGLVEIATDAELQAGTATGGTGAIIAAGGSSHSQVSAANKVPVGTADGLIDDSWLAMSAAGDICYSDGTKLNKLGATNARFLRMNGTTPEWGGANLDEANTFFGNTDISGAEAEDLTDSGSTILHYHPKGVGQATITASGAVNIAHGLGTTPTMVKIFASMAVANDAVKNILSFSNGSCTTASNETCQYMCQQDGATTSTRVGQDNTHIYHIHIPSGTTVNSSATVTGLDATNITLNVDVYGGGSINENIYLQWEAWA